MKTTLINTNGLPRDWKQKVAQRLEKKDVILTTHTIYDLVKGRNNNIVLQKKVLAEVARVKKEHQKHLQELEALKTEVAL
jgi:putative NIF3 family GTP cyclohydrolase 1 type 2